MAVKSTTRSITATPSQITSNDAGAMGEFFDVEITNGAAAVTIGGADAQTYPLAANAIVRFRLRSGETLWAVTATTASLDTVEWGL